jgi:uncharacterized membrane protein YdjX (TVP38/TMEM64 family)
LNRPLLWVALALLIAGLFAAWALLPVGEWIESLQNWVAGLGVWGTLIFAAVYVVAVVLVAPAAPLTIAAGLAFGVAIGFPLVVIAATIGAALAFLVARYGARERVERMFERRPKFKAVDKAVAEEGWKVVLLLRLSPLLPFNLQNYFYGLTDIKFWHYVVATFFGIMPGTLLYVYLGAAGQAAATGKESSPLTWAFFGAGLIATVIVTVLIARKAKAKLDELGIEQSKAGKAN